MIAPQNNLYTETEFDILCFHGLLNGHVINLRNFRYPDIIVFLGEGKKNSEKTCMAGLFFHLSVSSATD